MFVLKTVSGKTVLMKNGDPFIYSSRELARMGAHHLHAAHGDLHVSAF